MKKNKLLALLVVMALSFGLIFTGCSNDKDKDDKDSKNESVKDDEAPIEDDEDDDEGIKEDEEKVELSDEEAIVGEWSGKADFTDDMIKAVGRQYEGFDTDEFAIKIDVEITENEVSISFPSDGLDDATTNLYNACKDFCDSMLEAMADEKGMTVDELLESEGYTYDKVFEEKFQVDALVDALISDLEYSLVDMEGTTEYTIEDGKLFNEDGDAIEYELDGDELILYFFTDGMEIPLELERQ